MFILEKKNFNIFIKKCSTHKSDKKLSQHWWYLHAPFDLCKSFMMISIDWLIGREIFIYFKQ